MYSLFHAFRAPVSLLCSHSSLSITLTSTAATTHLHTLIPLAVVVCSGAEVKIESEGNAPVQIKGLDDFGFLRVVNKQGEQLSVQPDGNSFDMLRNLIAVKRD